MNLSLIEKQPLPLQTILHLAAELSSNSKTFDGDYTKKSTYELNDRFSQFEIIFFNN